MFQTKYGKTIKLFLLDADPNGRIICELSNWTGKAYRIPRGKVKDCADREELKSTAVYILFGGAESSAKKPKAYIGEAENVYNRLVSSPSSAAAIIMGRNANGLIEWKDKSGKSLKDIESGEIEKANKAINSDS